MPLITLPPTMQAFLIAWACGSWVKASLLIHYRPNVFKQKFHEDERRSIAFYYLILTYIVLRFTNSTTPLRPTALRLPTLLLLTLFSTLFDESIHLSLLRHFYRIRHSTYLIGAPASPELTSADCCICLGTIEPQQVSSFDTEEKHEEEDELKLESFCSVPHHVAHRHCMQTWLLTPPKDSTPYSTGPVLVPSPSERTCPSCRQPITAKFVKSRRRELKWSKFVEWRDVGFRWTVIAWFAGVLWGVGSLTAMKKRK